MLFMKVVLNGLSDGTTVKGSIPLMDGSMLDADQRNAPISVDTYI
jgi:hypothetical protein